MKLSFSSIRLTSACAVTGISTNAAVIKIFIKLLHCWSEFAQCVHKTQMNNYQLFTVFCERSGADGCAVALTVFGKSLRRGARSGAPARPYQSNRLETEASLLMRRIAS